MEHPKGGLNEHPASALVSGRGDLAHDSDGQVRPRYQLVPRPAGRLACGELAIEPALGPARVGSVTAIETVHRAALVAIAWTDDRGPGRAVARYPAARRFQVRAPHLDDVRLVRQGLDLAERSQRDVPDSVARLIAGHIHFGPRSALYSFAVSGRIWEDLYDELEVVATSREVYRPWVSALARYCLSREDTGPVPGWGPTPPEPAVDQPDTSSATQRATPAKLRPSTAKRISIETALKLIDAAFVLGVAASRSELSTIAARRFIEQRTAS